MFASLNDKVAPDHTTLVVVDVQNDFCAPGGMMHREGLDLTMVRQTVPRISGLLASARAGGVRVVFIQSIYGRAGNELLSESWLEQAQRRRAGSYTDYAVCEQGSWNFDFYEDVRPARGEVVVHKHRFSAFRGTNLELVLRSTGTRTVVVCGVATNVCVETTAREAFVNDFHVVIAGDCSATYTADEQTAALRTLDRYFGEVVDLDALRRCWSPLTAGAAQRVSAG